MRKRTFRDEAEMYNYIFDNLINGNITDFRESIRALDKFSLVDLIQFNFNVGSLNTSELITQIKRALK